MKIGEGGPRPPQPSQSIRRRVEAVTMSRRAAVYSGTVATRQYAMGLASPHTLINAGVGD